MWPFQRGAFEAAVRTGSPIVRYVLDEKDRQIFASNYQLHLPTEEQLRAEIQRELENIDADISVPQSAKGKRV